MHPAGRRLYLAYGSNLSRTQLHARCPRALAVAPALLAARWQLGFFGARTQRWGAGGVATLVNAPSAAPAALTPAALYQLTPEDEARLDGFEGWPGFYSKREDFARFITAPALDSGDIVFAYLKVDLAQPNPPSALYLDTIALGYRDWGFTDYLDRLRRAAGRPASDD